MPCTAPRRTESAKKTGDAAFREFKSRIMNRESEEDAAFR